MGEQSLHNFQIEGRVDVWKLNELTRILLSFIYLMSILRKEALIAKKFGMIVKRSEELFWEMMDEIHHEEEFVPEGPLWIQVQALDKGLEVLVTKAQLSNDGQRFELPISEEKLKDLPINDRIEEFLDEHFSI